MIGLICFAVGLLIMLSLMSYARTDPSFGVSTSAPAKNIIGVIGAYLADSLFHIIGVSAYLFPLFLFGYGAFSMIGAQAEHPHLKKIGALILLVSCTLLGGLSGETVSLFGEDVPAGGMFGGLLSWIFEGGFSATGAYIIASTALAIALMLLTPIAPSKLLVWFRAVYPPMLDHARLAWMRHKARREKEREEKLLTPRPSEPPTIVEPKRATPSKPPRQPKPAKVAQPTFEFMSDADAGSGEYKLPSPELLDPVPPSTRKISDKEIIAMSELLANKLRDFGVDGRIVQVHPGPVITMFEFEPAPGIKVAKIQGLSDDLALAMKTASVRIATHKGVVGIEVPNTTRDTVYFRQLIESEEYQANKGRLKIPLGKNIFGEPIINTIDKMPHLLVAGATGSGKSVAVNSFILSLLFNLRPTELKLVMIDPKMIELSGYEDIPHLLTPVVTQPKKAAETLRAVVAEMERRYKQLKEKGSKNIESYNKAVAANEKLPYIVVIIDELADLMMTVQREVEDSIIRLAQMARAAGIHLIVATQRPSVDVLTGLIKTNLPTRISFKVSSKIDSRTILDGNGAETLLGMGDMLFIPPGQSHPFRVHGCYVNEAEAKRVVEFVKQQGKPDYSLLVQRVQEIMDAETTAAEEGERDELYAQAIELVKLNKQASTSFLQRRLRVGYNRAARMIEMMEEDGIIGPADGAKPREVLVRTNMDGTVREFDDI